MLANRFRRSLLLAALALTAHPMAQSNWARQTSVFPLAPGPLCQDVQPNNILMVAGRETALWDGTRWSIAPAMPPALSNPALACDTTRGRVVLFGGYDPAAYSVSNATWEWDGVAWRQLSPATAPPARTEHAMAFDPARGRVVLCGGRDAMYRHVNDTWEWDGTTWTQVAATTSPPARGWHAMAWHGNLGRVLLFGGRSQTANRLGDTWAFDGANWTQLAIGFGPAPRYLPYLAPDAAGNVLLQGGSMPAPGSDTWVFDGTNWSALAPVNAPIGLANTTMAQAAGRFRTVMLATDPGNVTQVYEWNGVNWLTASRHELLPEATGVMAGYTSPYDGSRGVMLHSEGAIWKTMTGTYWELSRVPSTGIRWGAAVAHDTRRARTVLFGGFDGAGYSNDTLEFYGGGSSSDYLTRMAPAQRPPPQLGGLMAYDAARRQSILLGVDALNGARSTWAWDGTNWTQLQGAQGTPSAAMAGMANDPYLQRILLFGRAVTTGLAETWEWDGTVWRQRQPAVSPPARTTAAMTFDEVRGRVTLFGGGAPGPVLFNDTWEWDGSTWLQVVTASAPAPRSGHAMVHLSGGRRTILFGGGNQLFPYLPETWTFSHAQPASWTSFEMGCYGFQRYATLGALNHRPWLGETVLLQAMLVPTNGPVALLVGDSRTSYAGLPLPLDLTGIGMTWCQLLVAPRLFAGMATANAVATTQFQVPLDLGLVGGAFYAQAMAFDPTANPFGAYMSNGLEGRFGLR